MSSPFRKIMWFTVGDFVAKAAYFLAFIHLARTLGVEAYGTLEFALALLMYFVKIADGGLEMWAMRGTARGEAIEDLVSRVVPLRLLLGCAAFAVLLMVLPALPDFTSLRILLVIFGFSILVEASSLRWVFMGRERLVRAAAAMVGGQFLFAIGVFVFIHDPESLPYVAGIRVAADLFISLYFFREYIRSYGRMACSFSLRDASRVLREAIPFGLTHLLGLAAYSVDTLLLGFLKDAHAVGLYNAAYRPVTVCLAIPLAYFQGLYPVLSRTFSESREAFHATAERSFRLAALAALPLAIGATFLAEPVLEFAYGGEYVNAATALQLLGWSGMLVMLRGTFRQGLLAAGFQVLDLRCSIMSVAINVALNLALIPMYGIVGAAAATVISEMAWVAVAGVVFQRKLVSLSIIAAIWTPLTGAAAMVGSFILMPDWSWWIQGSIAVAVYAVTVVALGGLRTLPTQDA